MAQIIDLQKERVKRGKAVGQCSHCGYVYYTRDLTLVADDAELYVLCGKCKMIFDHLEKKQCPECHRMVYFLCKQEDGTEVCLICHDIQELPDGELTEINMF